MVSRYSLNAMSRFPSLPEAERDLLLITVWGSSCPNRWQNQEDLPAPPNFILCFVPLVRDHLCESRWGAAHALIGALHGISLQEQPDMLMGWWDKADKTQHTSNVSLLDFPSLFFYCWTQLPISLINAWFCVNPCLGLSFHSAGPGKNKGQECLRFQRSPRKLKPFISS